jgi:hypothetical protein
MRGFRTKERVTGRWEPLGGGVAGLGRAVPGWAAPCRAGLPGNGVNGPERC